MVRSTARLALAVPALALCLSMTACDQAKSLFGKTPAAVPVVAVAPSVASTPAGPVAAIPDAGKLASVAVNATGAGATAAEAVDEAMRMALKQVNGTTMDLDTEQIKLTLTLARGRNAEALRGSAFAEHVVQSADGAITGFKVNSLEGPDGRGFYKADLEVSVAKYVPPAVDSKKLKIVVAPLRYEVTSFPMGGRTVSADAVAESLRQQVIAALTNTGRFVVLDRDMGGDVAQELDLISSGQAPRAEFGKIGQAMSADVIWVGRISSFAYNRSVRKLQTSDRELTSYAGGWAVSQKLVNVATREIMLSDALSGQAPSVAPTTMGSGVDGDAVSERMQNDIAGRVVSGIVSRTFPVTVVSHEGNNVVLSQGGQAVKEGSRYKLVAMGKEMFDPQTNQSLGRVESDCCEVTIERVTPTMAMGRLDHVEMSLDGLQPGALQLRGVVNASKPVAVTAGVAVESGGKLSVQKAKSSGAGNGASRARTAAPVDDKW
jgi:curli biogenesis system outer membrane secretion channel CsgG